MIRLTTVYPLLLTRLSFLIALTSHTVFAQEVGLDDGEHLPTYNAQVGVDGNYSTGNFNMRRVNGRATLFKRWDDEVAAMSSSRYSYMKTGDIKFADDFRSVLIITHRPLSTFQLYAIGLYHKSYTRFIDRRWMGGLGAAYSWLRSQEHQLKLGLSASREWTRWDGRTPPFSPEPMMMTAGCLYKGDADPRSCSRQMWRLIPRLVGHHEFFEKHLIADYEALWVINPEDLSDERVYASITLSVPILKWLSVYTHYDVSFESIILDHRERLDAHITAGLKLSTIGQARSSSSTSSSSPKK